MHRTLEEDTAKPEEFWLGSINACLDGALDTQVALLARSLAGVVVISAYRSGRLVLMLTWRLRGACF